MPPNVLLTSMFFFLCESSTPPRAPAASFEETFLQIGRLTNLKSWKNLRSSNPCRFLDIQQWREIRQFRGSLPSARGLLQVQGQTCLRDGPKLSKLHKKVILLNWSKLQNNCTQGLGNDYQSHWRRWRRPRPSAKVRRTHRIPAQVLLTIFWVGDDFVLKSPEVLQSSEQSPRFFLSCEFVKIYTNIVFYLFAPVNINVLFSQQSFDHINLHDQVVILFSTLCFEGNMRQINWYILHYNGLACWAIVAIIRPDVFVRASRDEGSPTVFTSCKFNMFASSYSGF